MYLYTSIFPGTFNIIAGPEAKVKHKQKNILLVFWMPIGYNSSMALYIDVKYLGFVSSALPMFKRKSDNLWNFRCPFCKDSEKKASKARGYIYARSQELFFRCHNCQYGTTFYKFLAKVDPTLHKEYMQEKFLDSKGESTKKEVPVIPQFKAPVFGLRPKIKLDKISDLDSQHWARKYMQGRMIPVDKLHLFYFAPDFKRFVEDMGSEKHKDLKPDDPRIVIPFYDEDHTLIAFQGRALVDNKIRYITIRMNSYSGPLIYGLDRVNKDSPVYVVEGPIDSIFLPNCIAVAGSDLNRVSAMFKNPVMVFDNEPRNKDICKIMALSLSKGHRIVIWPDDMKEKDINDIVGSGKDACSIMMDNIHSGLTAQAKFAFWRKA